MATSQARLLETLDHPPRLSGLRLLRRRCRRCGYIPAARPRYFALHERCISCRIFLPAHTRVSLALLAAVTIAIAGVLWRIGFAGVLWRIGEDVVGALRHLAG